MKKLLAALTISLLAVTSITSVTANAKDYSTIRFGVDASYAPFESKGPDGKLVGFDIDLGNEICARLHAKCVWVENDFDGMIPALKAKKFDGVLSSMSMTPQRAEQIAFSSKLFNTPTRLVAKKGSGILPTADCRTILDFRISLPTSAETPSHPANICSAHYSPSSRSHTFSAKGTRYFHTHSARCET